MIATREDNLMRAVVLFIILSILAAMMMMFVGCTQFQNMLSTPEGRYEALLITYNSTLDGVNILIDAGEITKEEAPAVMMTIKSAKCAIDILHGKILAGVDTDLAEKNAKAELEKLKGKAQ